MSKMIGGPSPYLACEYAQPFQPLGQPMPPPYDCRRPWNVPAPISPTSRDQLQSSQQIRFIVGSPQPGLHRAQSLSGFNNGFVGNATSQCNNTGRSSSRRSAHANRKGSRRDLQRSYHVTATVPFPEPQLYPANLYSPPPPYPGSPELFSSSAVPSRLGNSDRPEGTTAPVASESEHDYGLCGEEISVQPEHCTFLVDAVKEMDICSRIFSTWVEQVDRIELGKKDKVEASIVSMITGLADDAVEMLTASRGMLSSYKTLARLMDQRLSKIANSTRGGDLFSPSSQMKAQDDFQTLAIDVRVHSAEISVCVEKLQDRVHGLHDTVLRTHEKYSFRKKFWGWMCRVFQFIAEGLFLGGSIAAIAHPVGTVGTAVMHVGSSLASIVASVCDKIKESYGDEEKGLNEVLKLLQGKIPKSMRVAQTALEKFQAAHIVFRQHHRVVSGRASGFIAPGEAAKARVKWRKAASLLELKDGNVGQLDVDSIA